MTRIERMRQTARDSQRMIADAAWWWWAIWISVCFASGLAGRLLGDRIIAGW